MSLLSMVECNLFLNFSSVPSILPAFPEHSTSWFLPAFWHKQTALGSEMLSTKLDFFFLPPQSNSCLVTLTYSGAQKPITWVMVPLNFYGRINLRIIVRPVSNWNHRWLKRLLFMRPTWNLAEDTGQRAKPLSQHLHLSYPCLPDWLFDSPCILP